MEEKRINEIYRKADTLLRENRMKQAIELISEEIDSLNNWELRTRFSEVQTAYRYMLEYMGKGMPDPDRKRLYGELVGKTFLLNDEIAASRLSEHTSSYYCDVR